MKMRKNDSTLLPNFFVPSTKKESIWKAGMFLPSV